VVATRNGTTPILLPPNPCLAGNAGIPGSPHPAGTTVLPMLDFISSLSH